MLSIKYIYKGKAGKRETYIYHCQQKWPALPSQPIWLKLDLTEKKRDEIDKAVSTKHKVFRPAKFFWFLTIIGRISVKYIEVLWCLNQYQNITLSIV